VLEPVVTRDLLIVTPDFPPGPGGIQTLLHRIASSLELYRPRVDAIVSLLVGDPELARRLGAAGRERARVRFSNNRAPDEVEDVSDWVVAR
jgi:hypothetical protein